LDAKVSSARCFARAEGTTSDVKKISQVQIENYAVRYIQHGSSVQSAGRCQPQGIARPVARE